MSEEQAEFVGFAISELVIFFDLINKGRKMEIQSLVGDRSVYPVICYNNNNTKSLLYATKESCCLIEANSIEHCIKIGNGISCVERKRIITSNSWNRESKRKK